MNGHRSVLNHLSDVKDNGTHDVLNSADLGLNGI